jgi:hypothetical protein
MIELDSNISKKLNSGMATNEGVELPFAAPILWALNGQSSYKAQGGAAYFGGWACDTDNLQAVLDAQALPMPTGWTSTTLANRDGSEYDATLTRHIVIAPIAKRQAWISDGQRTSDYQDGARRHVQVLCYMAEKTAEGLVPWGPVVLSAKGYQARNLLDAFSKWDKAIGPMKRKFAASVPSWCFYLSLGTFDKERKVEQVGKNGAQSPITPISAYVPDTIDEALLKKLFVGQEVAGIMADLLDQAADWLGAWKGEAEPAAAAAAQTGPRMTDNGFIIPDSSPF